MAAEEWNFSNKNFPLFAIILRWAIKKLENIIITTKDDAFALKSHFHCVVHLVDDFVSSSHQQQLNGKSWRSPGTFLPLLWVTLDSRGSQMNKKLYTPSSIVSVNCEKWASSLAVKLKHVAETYVCSVYKMGVNELENYSTEMFSQRVQNSTATADLMFPPSHRVSVQFPVVCIF